MLGLVTLVMLLVALFLLPVLREQTGQAFHMRAYVLCRMLGLPLLYLFAAAFFMSVFSLFWDFRIKNTAVRRILLVPSAVFVLLYMGTVTLAWTVFVNRDVSWLFGAMFHVSDFYIAPAPAVFLLPGIGLYLGLKKRP